jgi:hypothetical protein
MARQYQMVWEVLQPFSSYVHSTHGLLHYESSQMIMDSDVMEEDRSSSSRFEASFILILPI